MSHAILKLLPSTGNQGDMFQEILDVCCMLFYLSLFCHKCDIIKRHTFNGRQYST